MQIIDQLLELQQQDQKFQEGQRRGSAAPAMMDMGL
jgi:hypothetical protein